MVEISEEKLDKVLRELADSVRASTITACIKAAELEKRVPFAGGDDEDAQIAKNEAIDEVISRLRRLA
jgi:hypothetical protein